MELGEKLVQLRALAGERRGFGRPMTQSEVAQAVRAELGVSLSQAYLSQLERGKRVHLSNTSRETLARFFQVHPGYLVSDLPGHSDASCGLPYAHTHAHVYHFDELRHVPGLALAPDLGVPIHTARQHETASFPASERRDVPLNPVLTALPTPTTPHAPAWIGDPVRRTGDLIPGTASITAYPYPQPEQRPARGPRPRPTVQPSAMDARLFSLLSRLRDHPQAGRVLALVEQIAHLAPDALDETEALVRKLSPDEQRERDG